MKRTMKRIIKQVLVGMLCLTLLQSPVFLLQTYAKPASLYSAGAVLMDADTGRILYGKNEKTSYAMASTTKIMTCILALELGDEKQVVTISENAARQPDVQMNAKAGEQYYLKDLLHSRKWTKPFTSFICFKIVHHTLCLLNVQMRFQRIK